MAEPVAPPEDKSFERRERVLHTYYQRLNDLDKSIRELTSFFFGINTALLALVFQVVKDNPQRFFLALLGYCVSVTIYLTTYKSFLSWQLYAQDMVALEGELDYCISHHYDRRLAATPGQAVRVTLVRMRFNFLFILLWTAILAYLIIKLAGVYTVYPPGLNVLVWVVLMAAILYLPWSYLVGTLRPGVLWATLHALWAREV